MLQLGGVLWGQHHGSVNFVRGLSVDVRARSYLVMHAVQQSPRDGMLRVQPTPRRSIWLCLSGGGWAGTHAHAPMPLSLEFAIDECTQVDE